MIERNLHALSQDGRQATPSEWAEFMGRLFNAREAGSALESRGGYVRGQVGEVKAQVLEVVGLHPDITAPAVCRFMPGISTGRVNCSLSQLFKSRHVSRTGAHGRYSYRIKGA